MKFIIIFLLLIILVPLVYAELEYDNEASDAPIVKEMQIDVDSDGVNELVKATWGPGVSDKPLKIEIFKDGNVIDTVHNEFGIQPNYTLKDIDNDGKQELIIWQGLWDFRLPGEDGMTEEEYEGHSASHRHIVATYKWLRNEYYLWDVYTTKKKQPAWSETMPPRD